MDEELLNPRRQYKHFRPRQAQRALKQTGTPTNRGTIALFNNSTGAQVLAVRDFVMNGTTNDTLAASYQPGAVGASPGLAAPLLPTDPIRPGQLLSVDTTTVYAGDYVIPLNTTGNFEWFHEFPFAMITPGFSLVFQCTVAAHAITVSILWEAIEIDQLDYFY